MVPDEAQVYTVGDDDLSAYGDLELQLYDGMWKASNSDWRMLSRIINTTVLVRLPEDIDRPNRISAQ